jgi:predicted flap endonuclease-1-like 5' DNA nuclease
VAGLADIEGISPAHAEKLKVQGLHTTEDLLKAGATPKSRGDLAAITGISESLILRWTNMADLFRIKGVAEQYSDLLEASGVDTVPELAQRNPEHLLAKMTQVNTEKGLVHRVPTQEQVVAWVSEAKTLPRMISYGGEAGAASAAKHDDLAGPDTKSSAWDSGDPQAEAAVSTVWAPPQLQMDEVVAGADTKSGAWDSGVLQAEPAAIPSWTAKGVDEWWGKRLWRSLRRPG